MKLERNYKSRTLSSLATQLIKLHFKTSIQNKVSQRFLSLLDSINFHKLANLKVMRAGRSIKRKLNNRIFANPEIRVSL